MLSPFYKKSSYKQNKVHYINKQDEKIPACSTKIYAFEYTEMPEKVDCKKCLIILDAIYRAEMRDKIANSKRNQEAN